MQKLKKHMEQFSKFVFLIVLIALTSFMKKEM